MCDSGVAESENGMESLEIGGVVVYIDEHRAEHNALVTAIHGDPQGRLVMPRRKPKENPGSGGDMYDYETDENGVILNDYGPEGESWPCVNLLIVSPTEACQDQYGRQLERYASVVHMSSSSAQGFCYRFPSDKLDSAMRQPTVS